MFVAPGKAALLSPEARHLWTGTGGQSLLLAEYRSILRRGPYDGQGVGLVSLFVVFLGLPAIWQSLCEWVTNTPQRFWALMSWC